MGYGLYIQGSGLRGQGSGFRVQSLEFRVWRRVLRMRIKDSARRAG